MNRLAFRVFVLLTVLIVLAAAASYFFRHPPAPVQRNPELEHSTPVPVTQVRRYTDIGMGKGVSQDGRPTSFRSYSTSDGMRFSQCNVYHSSKGEAQRGLRRALRKATDIIKREPLFDEKGSVIGEKFIATFPAKYPRYAAAALLWTDGATIRYVASSSLENILEHEKDAAHR
ncbi:MAG TPA: hypothetical protein VJU86_10595 [Pyrinomonadaceae bacterium]|nr:hypothetical protein [Pyrinomonadaceae bacterium]